MTALYLCIQSSVLLSTKYEQVKENLLLEELLSIAAPDMIFNDTMIAKILALGSF